MRLSVPSVFLALAYASTSALAQTYTLSSSVVGSEFLSAFTFEAIADPTSGFVTYVDEATAQSDGLISSTSASFRMGADSTTTLSPTGAGRNSVRIKSNAAYTTHVAVFDLDHMPEGCGTWPAIWEVDEADWPDAGEIDIVEGVNNVTPNQSTLHTGPGCTIPANGGVAQYGTTVSTDCNANDDGNAGCGVQSPDSNSFGPAFNAAGGGYYAMERTTTSIKVWFWARDSAYIPAAFTSGATSIDTSSWGEPTAYFPNTDCDIDTEFGSLNIVINLTFCGDWAGSSSVYAASGCSSTCIDYVAENPSAFVDAYFDFASLTIYE
ncbi:glycoside hydrolase family 16 protein [Athelia psychrophila]|uniref:Glycoside hydrolase family 16 protein n=1 Tax=Athelia psychrophila TaxID=1759441 RepID=A0A166PIB2_9AGAM|nr:glycoside hydrolase family 16 protein [Fibularhizoctonia sp. CBS 109695]